ncbi:MAG: type II toxin-antitoxin system death-on-curing family toxin [Campylobacterota bacterium]|nr:type II toxin-antitoxin system death-on-curing family toxin [Campylobacterota bacterium]
MIIYIKLEQAVSIHDKLIEMSGGMSGNNNIGLLDSVLDFIQDDDYYPTFEEKLTHLIYSVNKNHAFSDGNKRSSIALGATFLEFNGYDYCVTYFINQMENIAVQIASSHISKELLAKIVKSIIYEPEYPEELKLEIINATMTQDYN